MHDITTFPEAMAALEDVLGSLQEIYYRLEQVEDLEAYGVRASLLAQISAVLARYEAEDY